MSDIPLETIKKQIQEKEKLFKQGQQQYDQLNTQINQLGQQRANLEKDLLKLSGEHKALFDLLPPEDEKPKKPELTTVKNKEKKKK